MNVKTFVTAAALALTAGAASAGGTYNVDALGHCLDFGTGSTPGFVEITLGTGVYKASVLSSTTVFNPAFPDEINSVVAVLQDLNVLGAISLTKTMTITVGQDTSSVVRLLITDSICGDNSGSTVVKFKKVS